MQIFTYQRRQHCWQVSMKTGKKFSFFKSRTLTCQRKRKDKRVYIEHSVVFQSRSDVYTNAIDIGKKAKPRHQNVTYLTYAN
jgi:hypothetical protein